MTLLQQRQLFVFWISIHFFKNGRHFEFWWPFWILIYQLIEI